MSRILLDTNIVSYLFKNDTRAFLYRNDLDNSVPYISIISKAELLRWPILRAWGRTRINRFKTTLQLYQTLQTSKILQNLN